MLENGTDKCSCANVSCERNGKCKECKAFHAERESLTRCQREKKELEEKENTEKADK